MRAFFAVAGLVLQFGAGVGIAAADDWPTVPNEPLHWQLQGDIDIGGNIRVTDSDLFETTTNQVQEWREAGIFPICYINVGAIEEWNDDYAQFPKDVIGNPYWGWAGENWLDISRFEQFAHIMEARFDLCREKGFLGVEPDNIDAYEADGSNKKTGFDLTRSDQLRYVGWLIEQAHARGLAIGQKNAGELVPELVGRMDFALLESSFRFGFMDAFLPYAKMKKPVFAVEYIEEGTDPDRFCPEARKYGFQGVVAHLELDQKPENCP
ncbi:endo alpha-1,4 polygalactosaminidase [Thalassospira xiamenensis]|uniref:Glycoside-hydrolase family GH114 n=1 Tax=Thalassospira xiamenensis TaxID=220697 RepID=A0A285TX37_9PROT|nr:endo alpha-1,4 polygalactosaminidase [Thalassospira xiamenensis]SOC29572.1 Glycoside-hydrolase family GH114 [Thalassospira xiamenensis]